MEEQTAINCCQKWKEPKIILIFFGIVLLAGVITVSILRDAIVNRSESQVTVIGRGEVEFRPDIGKINLGVQVDKAPTAENALVQMNDKMNAIIQSVKILGIPEEDIQTQEYNLFPQYDYKDGSSTISGYGASQQLVIKVKDINDSNLLNKVVAEASKAGANQVLGVNFEISDINNFKQQARILAIKDARSKSEEMAKAAGIRKLKKVIGWYETEIESPNMQNGVRSSDAFGLGGMEAPKAVPSPNIPSGSQKIVIEVGLNYEVR